MLVEYPQNLLVLLGAAFLFGWILSSVSFSLTARYRARKRDSRDDRIRSLEADLRVAQSGMDKGREKIEALEADVTVFKADNEKRDNVISHQQTRIETLSKDLKDSVLKTRELRAELSDRAEENLRSEVKLREVETELSVVHASTDMMATGMLDFSVADDDDEIEASDRRIIPANSIG